MKDIISIKDLSFLNKEDNFAFLINNEDEFNELMNYLGTIGCKWNGGYEMKGSAYQENFNIIYVLSGTVYHSSKRKYFKFLNGELKWQHGNFPDLIDMSSIKKTKLIKKMNLEDDPWDEEDWGWESIEENAEYKDLSFLNKEDNFAFLINNEDEFNELMNYLGTIGCKWNGGYEVIGSKYDGYNNIIYILSGTVYHSSENTYGQFLNNKEKWQHGNFPDLIDMSSIKKTKLIKKMNLEDDPWDEEDWGWKAIKETIDIDDKKEYVLYDYFKNYFKDNIDKYEAFFKNELRGRHIECTLCVSGHYMKVMGFVKDLILKSGGELYAKLDNGLEGSLHITEPVTVYQSKKSIRKKRNIEEDPWNEEDWGWEYIEENAEYKDLSFLNKEDNFIFFVSDEQEYNYLMDYLEEMNYRWSDGNRARFFSFDNKNYYIYVLKGIIYHSEEDTYNRYLNGIDKWDFGGTVPELIHISDLKKGKRILNLEDDPWGEENWEWEEIKENKKLNDFKENGIRFKNVEEMKEIATILKELGYEVYNYDVIMSDTNTFNYGGYVWGVDNIEAFSRCGWVNTRLDNALSYGDFISIAKGEKRKKRKINPEDDPWGEENWGWEEIKENLKKKI